jgi:predicted Zn-dependent protease
VLDQAPINVAAIHYLAIAYLDAGEIAKARTLLESRRDEFRNNFLWRSAWALLLACEGKRSEALEAMDDEIHKFARIAFGETLQIAEFYAVIGDVSKAVDWVETAVRSGDERAHWFRRSPRLTAIQTDPRFLRILQSVEARRKPGSRRDPSQG